MRHLRPKHMIISSQKGMSLNFVTDEEYEEYERETLLLARKWQRKIRDKYGFWASNQGKFVSSLSELNEWDRREEV
jgi:hypothetical protein